MATVHQCWAGETPLKTAVINLVVRQPALLYDVIGSLFSHKLCSPSKCTISFNFHHTVTLFFFCVCSFCTDCLCLFVYVGVSGVVTVWQHRPRFCPVGYSGPLEWFISQNSLEGDALLTVFHGCSFRGESQPHL